MSWGYFMQDIGKRVAALRTAKQISQRELANRCEVSQPTIANIERGRTKEIKGFVLEALSRELNTSSKFILEGADNSQDHEAAMLHTELTQIYWKLSEEERETVLTIARALAGKKASPPIKKVENVDKAIAELTK